MTTRQSVTTTPVTPTRKEADMATTPTTTPRFRVGDWVVYRGSHLDCTGLALVTHVYRDGRYGLSKEDGFGTRLSRVRPESVIPDPGD